SVSQDNAFALLMIFSLSGVSFVAQPFDSMPWLFVITASVLMYTQLAKSTGFPEPPSTTQLYAETQLALISVDVEVLHQHSLPNDAYIARLRLNHVRIIRLRNGGRIKHTVDQNLEEKLSKPFLFLQDVKGNITQVFFPHHDQPELVGLKKGIVSALNLKIHPDLQNITYSTEEEDDSGIHLAYYNVNERNFTHLHLTKKWGSVDYLKHVDGRPVEGEQHSKSHYYTSLEIQDGAIKSAKRTHFSYLWSDAPYNRPLNKPEFQQQPNLELKASGESHLNLLRCVSPTNKRSKRSSEQLHSFLENLKQDTLSYDGIHRLKWSSIGDPDKPSRSLYELLRCYSDPSVKESELSECIRELHYLAKIDDEIFENIVNLTLERSHLNFSTWSGLVGAIVVRGDYKTQKILSRAILSEEPRPLLDREHAKLLEAVFFIPAGPLYPELLQALLSLHKNSSKSDEITVRAMLVTSGLVRKCHDAGYNRSLSESIAQHLHQNFKTHPARFHDEESQSHDEYIWSHVCAFGNLGHISSLNLITRYLDHDSSGIRYFAVSALRKLPTRYTDHQLLRILRNDEHVTVKAGVIEVFIERRQTLTNELRDAIEDALWISEEGDELDSKIVEFLENHNDKSHHVIKKLRKRRSIIRRKKRALIPALKPREFSLGVQKEWQKSFGGGQAGAETILRFANYVKLKIGIFGGSFEVNLDNMALFRAHVIKWSFDIVNGKAAFRMGAGFKNDIPKDLVHTIADNADSILANIDGISSIFTQHIQRFLDKLKKYLPFSLDRFVKFISETVEFLARTIQVTRFGNFFNGIVINLRSAWRASEFWLRIGNLVKKLTLNLSNINLSAGSFGGAFNFLNKLVDLFSRLRFRLPRNFPVNFNIKKFLTHINRPFHSTSDAVEDYFKTLGFNVPKNFFEMFHFNFALNFIPTLDKFKIFALRLAHFGNRFLEMLSVFRDMFNIELPRLYLPEFNLNVNSNNVFNNKDFDFGLPFDWRITFNFKTDFSGPDFAKLTNLFRFLTEVFLSLSNPNINFEQFFVEILPEFRIKFGSKELFGDEDVSNIAQWFQLVVKSFHNLLNHFDSKLFDLSNTANFLDELSKIIGHFSKGTLANVCKLQDFMLKSAGKLEVFGENLEKDMILGIRNVRNEAKQAIGEIINITLFVDEFIDELKQTVSSNAKTFVEQYLTALEGSLENVAQLADISVAFSLKSADKLNGLCHKTTNISGDILDQIQSAAQNAVSEIADFVTSNSEGLAIVIDQFKVVVKTLEDWHQENLAKHLGKVTIVSQTIDEFLSLIKTENKVFSDIHNVFKNINNVIQHLNNLPAHAQKAYDFADNIRDFETNAKRWGVEFGKLNIRQQFNVNFDEKLRKLCNEFHSFAKDTIKQIQNDNLFKIFREFVTKQTDFFISQSVKKLNFLKVPLGKARKNLEEMSNSVEEIEAFLLELRPFSENFSPVFQEIRQLPNCSDIYSTFDNIITNSGKKAVSFGKQAYKEYSTMKSEMKAFLELLPDEWESLSLQKCISGGTCLSNSLKKQGQSVSNKMEKLKKKFNDFNFEDKLETCKDSVEEVSQIFEKIENISKLVKEFSFKEEILKIRDLSQRITGKFFGDGDGHESQVKKRSAIQPTTIAKNIAEYTRKADKTQEMMKTLVEDIFNGLEKVSRHNIEPFQTKLENVRQQLNVSFLFGKSSAVIGPILQPLQSVVKSMTDFIQTCNNVVDPLKGTILDVLFKTSDFTEIFEGKLKHYGETVTEVSEEVSNLIDKITSFLNTVQLRQKGLDILNYKEWNQYQHCSAEVCLRLMRRSSALYLGTIFLWKYPHLDDLSSTSLSKTGKWLAPGLFDDYKIRGIAQLSDNEMLLGMRGVAANAEKASLLAVVDITSSNSEILKIVQLEKDGVPFRGDMGGVVVVKSLIWISSGNSLYGVRLSDIRNSMSLKRPSTISISKIKYLHYQVTSISYDDRDNKIWILEGNKAHNHDVGTFGGILEEKNSLVVTEEHTRGFTIVRQFGIKYACVAKCSLIAGYQCRLEFHKIDAGVLDESSILRVVRTPTGLEAIQTVDTEHVVAAFSSATFSEKDKIQQIGGDFEDRYFKFNVPVLKTNFSITENCLYFKVGWNWLIPRKPLFPFNEMICGTRRKRRALERALDEDVYTDELEKHHRTRRQATGGVACISNIEGKPFTGSLPIVPKIGFTVPVFGIPVYFFFGADLYYYANYRISLCLRDREVRLALIPGVWLTVYAGASLPLIIVEAGITVEAKILQTYLIPELSVRVDKWPLNACIQLKMQMTPLSIRVYLWYRFRLCPDISYEPWFSISISWNWCAKKTFAEWTWSLRSIHKTVFDNCKRDIDNTRPGVGVCNAKQVGNKKYLIQWQGFTEDTKIETYIVTIGSIFGSGDDHYSIHEERQSLTVPNLEIMHGRSVYVGVYAINGGGLKSDVAHCLVFTAKRRSPVITFINDGDSSTDIDYQTDATSLSMKYGFEGTFSDLSSITWGISSSGKCTFSESEADVLPLQNIGESYTIKKTGLNLISGSKYYTRIIVVNLLGLATVACSDGTTIDTTPPIPRKFTVGKNGGKFIPSVRRVSGKFEHFIDNESPIVHYEWKLIDEYTGKDVTSFTTIPLTQMSPLLDGLSLTSGGKYTAVLKGTNAAGLHAVVNVSGIIPDDTIPVCEGLPHDVIGFNDVDDRNFVSSLTNLTAMFSCYDDDSGIQSIQAGVGTYPGGEDVHSFVDITDLALKESEDRKTTWVTFVNVNITKRIRYHVTVKVEDMTGYRRTISSDGILMDTTAPTVLSTYIRDGLKGIDRKYSKEFDVFPAHWENAFADTESGIGEYFVGLGSSAGLGDKSAFRSTNLSTKALLRGDSLESGMKYYVTVVACNRVGICVNGSSNGAIVDFIPPHTGLVTAGQKGPPLEITWINKAAWARWQWCSADRSELSASPDTCDALSFYDEHSGIRRFGLTVLSYDTAKMLTQVKIVGRVVSGGLHVVMPNGVFSVVVKAEDRAGGSSNAISKSFIIDTTPPKIVKLYHGKENEQIMYTRAKDYLFTAFFEITEDISDIVSYSVGVSTFPEGDDLVSFTKYGINVVANIICVNWTLADTKTLINGRKYYITVKSTNAAGLFLINSSPPLVFDNEPPLVSLVFDGWGIQDSQYHPFPNIYRMHWQGVSDISGMRKLKYA
ncbi:DNA double-strand break repair Rad50 ATPase, partial [Paramuricea clavata]